MDQESRQSPLPHESLPVPPLRKRDYFLPFSILISGVLISGSVWYASNRQQAFQGRPMGGGSQEMAQVGGALDGPVADTASGIPMIDDDVVLGDPDASVTLIEFGDYQCPFCGVFYHEVEPKIKENYVKTGKVRMVYRDFAFLGQESLWAAEAAECAKDQGRYWDFHDYLFSNQNGENQGAFNQENVKQFASTLGLDRDQFDPCFDGGTYRNEVTKDTADAQRAGVSGTPTTFINGKMLFGALPYEAFEAAIEEALNAL